MTIKNTGLNFSELLNQSFKILGAHFWTILSITVCITIPVQLGIHYSLPVVETTTEMAISNHDIAQMLFEATFGLLILLATIYITIHHQNGHKLKWHDALNLSISKWLPAIILIVLYGSIILTGFLMLIVPGFIAFILFYFSFYALSIKNLNPVQSLEYSYRLVKTNIKQIVGYIFLITILSWATAIGINTLQLMMPPGTVVDTSFLIISKTILCVFTIMTTLLFIQLDYQKDQIEREFP